MNETIGTKQLASILGISVQRVNELGRKGKIQRERDGGWNLVKVNAALHRNMDKHQALKSLGQVAQSPVMDGGQLKEPADTFADAQREHEWLKVQKAELELRMRKEELVEKAQVKEEIGKLLTNFKNKLLYIPDKLARKVAPISDDRECRALIDNAIREALVALSEYEPDVA